MPWVWLGDPSASASGEQPKPKSGGLCGNQHSGSAFSLLVAETRRMAFQVPIHSPSPLDPFAHR